MKADVAQYRRSAVGHPDRSYDFLFQCMEAHIAERREDSNQQALEKSVTHDAPPAMPGTTVCKFWQKGSCKF